MKFAEVVRRRSRQSCCGYRLSRLEHLVGTESGDLNTAFLTGGVSWSRPGRVPFSYHQSMSTSHVRGLRGLFQDRSRYSEG